MGFARIGLFFLAGSVAFGSIRLERVESMGVRSFQHASLTSEIICHPDGVHVLSSSRDCCVRLWELKSGKLVRRFVDPGGGDMWGIRLVNGGKEFLAASGASQVLRFDVATGKVLMTYKHSDDVYRIAVHPDGKHFVSTGSSKAVVLWELATGKKIRSYDGHTGSVYTAIVTNDGKRIITGSSDNTVREWDLESGKCTKTLNEKPTYDDVFTLAKSPDGKRFAMASEDKFIRVFDSATLKEIWKSKLKDNGQVVAWSPDGKLVATAADDENLYLLDASNGETVRKIETGERSHTPIAFSNDGKILVSGDSYYLHLHDVETGKPIKPGMGFGIRYDAVAVDGKKTYLADGWKIEVKDREEPANNLTVNAAGSVGVMALSPDGKFLAVGCSNGMVNLRETEKLAKVVGVSLPRDINALDFSEDGSMLAAVDERGGLAVWSMPSGKKVCQMPGGKTEFNDVVFLPGGDRVMTADDDKSVKVWSVPGGENLFSLKVADYDPDDCLALDEGRSLLASGGKKKLYGRILPKLERKEISDPDEVKALLAQLGDDDFSIREDAMIKLAGFGEEVIPMLEAVKTEDPEVEARLGGVRSVMRGNLSKDGLEVIEEFDEVIAGVVADPLGRFWLARIGNDGVERIVVGVVDYEKKGVKIIQTLETIHGCDRLVVAPDGSHVASLNDDGTSTLFKVIEE